MHILIILSITLGLFLFFQKNLLSFSQSSKIKKISSSLLVISLFFVLFQFFLAHHISRFWEFTLLISTMIYVSISVYMNKQFWSK